MSGVGTRFSEVVLGGVVRQGWWLVVDEEDGPGFVLAGPFGDRDEAAWAAGGLDGAPAGLHPVYGARRADGLLRRRSSPQDRAWWTYLGEQLDRLPEGWDADLDDEHPLPGLVAEVVSALAEAGLFLYDPSGVDGELGGVCLTPEPALDGVVVSWRQHDRVSREQVHGAAADALVQQVMNRALGEVLAVRGLDVEPLGGAHVVRGEVALT
ncbi:hypothetical protein E4P41_00585 [Geodermatophilus sp. DF01-2]|uniref:hypothetical protein n=1 Tax=Geodermatophilus sp. DF01-2 TaxID=2559610 RepID=UPI00107442CB|nr:hypothetical protein [Geodermatophilus sp. DF01_2]TFV64769.1 hypothetical protein E4P41_00585 [Geodermatophilus sp. DF01_2]